MFQNRLPFPWEVKGFPMAMILIRITITVESLLTNLYTTKSSEKRTIFHAPVIASKIYGKEPRNNKTSL